MTDKPYQFSHVRLFHLAAFFKDHGWECPDDLRFHPGLKVWEGKHLEGWAELSLGDVVPVLQGDWVSWWQKLPTIETGFTNHVVKVKKTGVYEATWGSIAEHGADAFAGGNTVAHAIRNGVRGLLKHAHKIRSQLKVGKFHQLYSSGAIPTPEQDAVWNRVEAVLKALKPKKPEGPPSDAQVDALFPHEGKKKWLAPTEGKADQFLAANANANGMVFKPLDAADVKAFKKAMPSAFKDHTQNPKTLVDIFGPEKAAEMTAAEDAAFANQAGKPDGVIPGKGGVEFKTVAEGEYDQTVLDGMKHAKNFLIQEQYAKEMHFPEPSGYASKMFESMKLDFAALEMKLMKELTLFPPDVQVKALPSTEKDVAKVQVSVDAEGYLQKVKDSILKYAKDANVAMNKVQKVAEKLAKKMLKQMEQHVALEQLTKTLKANGASVDMDLLKASIEKFGWEKVRDSLMDVFNGKEAASPYTSITYKKNSPLLGEITDESPLDSGYEDEDPDAGKD